MEDGSWAYKGKSAYESHKAAEKNPNIVLFQLLKLDFKFSSIRQSHSIPLKLPKTL